MISQKELKQCVDYDPKSGLFTRKQIDYVPANARWEGATCGWRARNGYIRISINGKDYAAHRLAWLWVNGNMPSGDIDHLNGVRADNSFESFASIPPQGFTPPSFSR